MNAVVALCHFCEIHGPSVVMCTQPFRRQEDAEEFGEESDVCDASGLTTPSTSATTTVAGDCTTPQHYIPNEKVYDDDQVNDKSKEKAKCNACSSIPPDLTAFVSNDHAAKTSYVSSQCAKDNKLFVMMRQACLRSLSCEMYPRQEGPIYFGDDKRGHVLSYFFFLKDNKARGLQVRYSIVMVTLDKLYLLNSWSFLVRSIRQIAKRLELAANKVFDIERRISQPSRRNPPKHPASLRIASVNNIRSLAELTNDNQIFQRCHIWFTWLLRAGGQQWKEMLLEGPPIEDQATLFESQGLDEDVVDAVQTLNVSQIDVGPSVSSMGPEIATDAVEEAKLATAPSSVTIMEASSGSTAALKGPVLESVRQAHLLFGPEKFEQIAFHVIMGNQLVVRCEFESVVRSLLSCLAKLLPQKCVTCVPFTAAYLEEFRCKFLGLDQGADIPSHVLNRALLIDIVPVPSAPKDPDQVQLGHLDFRVLSNVRDIGEKPKFLKQVLNLIQSDPNQVVDSALERALLAFREDWIHKARLFYSFNRCERPKLDAREVESRYRGLLAALQMTKADESMVRFWTSGLSEHFKRQVAHGAAFRS